MLIKPSRQLVTQPHRHAWLEINLAALEQNMAYWRESLPSHLKMMAVVKADAYGHGALLVVPILKAYGVSCLGVSNIDEALQLRAGGVEMPILVLGATPEWAWTLAEKSKIQLTIFSRRDVEALSVFKKPLTVHVKVDTGMHRLGASPEEAVALIQQVQALPHVTLAGIFTHLANGNLADKNAQQWQIFETNVLNALETLPPCIHIANSPALWMHPSPESPFMQRCHLVRIGIGLWGYDTIEPKLLPVMGLKARITHLQSIPAGEGVSYGHTFVTAHTPSCLATVPLGYADGIPRGLSNRLWGRYAGHLIPQVGQITMDQMMFDFTPLLQAGVLTEAPQVGEIITLLEHGEAGLLERQKTDVGLSLKHWAEALDSIPYEMLCALRVRLPRSVVR
ncbi:MAG: alanine racemase [Vampirovibrio sp.]